MKHNNLFVAIPTGLITLGLGLSVTLTLTMTNWTPNPVTFLVLGVFAAIFTHSLATYIQPK